MNKGTIFSICIGPQSRIRKEVNEARVMELGIENDGDIGEWGRKWGRQISLLNLSSVLSVNKENVLEAGPGTFGENILVEGLDLCELSVGDEIRLGKDVVLAITQIGKENCLGTENSPLGINLLAYEGVFCKVIKCGNIKKRDRVEVFCSQDMLVREFAESN